MPKDKNYMYDSVFLELCNVRCRETENDFCKQTEDSLTFSNKNVEEAIDKLSSGKSPDEYGLSAEHLKVAKHLITPVQNKRLGLRIGTVYTGSCIWDDVAFLTKFKEELQIMFNEAKGYSGKHRYEIHPTKTNVVVAANEHKVKDNPSLTLGENLIQITDSAVHLGISRSGKKESNINTTELVSLLDELHTH